jgi:hypothetical protein
VPPASDGVPVPLLSSPLSVPPPPESLKGSAPSLALEAPGPIPNLTTLPPAIAASLAKLASVSVSAAPVMQPPGRAALTDAEVAQLNAVVRPSPPSASTGR